MPELPEVEVTRRKIAPQLEGRRIARLRTTADNYFFRTKPGTLRRRLKGRSVTTLMRQGKYLVARLDDGSSLVLHLGMTGQLFVEGASSLRLLSSTAAAALSPAEQPHFRPDEHTHLEIEFEDGGPRVFLRDVRKFGKVKWLAPGEEDPRLAKLGVDALEVTGPALYAGLRGRRVAVKSLLLDQAILAGVGNIYADEALFGARLDPLRPGHELSEAECKRLITALRRVLERSIDTGGSSISDYVSPDGLDGGYQDERQVYGRAGLPCLRCGTGIRRVVLGQRASHFCPNCQQ